MSSHIRRHLESQSQTLFSCPGNGREDLESNYSLNGQRCHQKLKMADETRVQFFSNLRKCMK